MWEGEGFEMTKRGMTPFGHVHGREKMTEQVVQRRLDLEKSLSPFMHSSQHKEACCVWRPRPHLTCDPPLPHSSPVKSNVSFSTIEVALVHSECLQEGRVGIQFRRTRHVCNTDEDILTDDGDSKLNRCQSAPFLRQSLAGRCR